MNEKIISNNKLAFHKGRIEEWMRKGDCAPIYAEIGLINICNHNCIFCGFDQERGRDIIDTDVLLRNLKDMSKLGVKSVCYSGAGEPCLHTDFSEIIKKTREYGIDAAFSTNAVLFNETKARKVLPYTSWIRFSIDAATSKTHAKIHNTSEEDFPIILENLKNAVEIKKENNYDVTLGAQFIVLEENVHELEKAVSLFREIGMDNIQIKPYSQHPSSLNRRSMDYKKLDELEKKLKTYSDDKFQVISRLNREEILEGEKKYPICFSLPFWTLINERGEVVPCHIFYSKPEFFYGNINDNLFSEIWLSERRKRVNEKVYGLGSNSCGRLGCRGDGINKFLYGLRKGEFSIEDMEYKDCRHVNFI